MKGVVFTEFIEMVEEHFSPETADRMLDESDLASGGAYTAVATYDHAEMMSLVGTLSRLVDQPENALVKAFGEHLFGRFAVLYPVFFTDDVRCAFDFLARIDGVIHVEVKKLYPDAELPRFEVESRTPERLSLIYESSRHLGDLAEGLIKGCLRHYGEEVEMRREPVPHVADFARERFVLTHRR